MLGGQQPADRELIKSWMRRDWAENLYPGASNAEGRKALEEHLDAMLDLESGQAPLIDLNGRLIEESQKTLARLSVAQRAYELLKSQARPPRAGDWVAGANGRAGRRARVRGRPATRRSTPSASRNSSPMRAFSTTSSSGSAISPIASSATAGCLGRPANRRRCRRNTTICPTTCWTLYTTDFIAAWRDALGKLRLRKMTGRQAEIHRAQRAVGADLADQAADRINPRRDRADARTRRARRNPPRRQAGRAATKRLRASCSRPRTGAGRRHRGRVQALSDVSSKATARAGRSRRSSATSTKSPRTCRWRQPHPRRFRAANDGAAELGRRNSEASRHGAARRSLT